MFVFFHSTLLCWDSSLWYPSINAFLFYCWVVFYCMDMPVYLFIHPRVGILVVSRSWAWTSLLRNICFYCSWGNTQCCLPKRNSWITWQVNGGHFQKLPNCLLLFVSLSIPTCTLEAQTLHLLTSPILCTVTLFLPVIPVTVRSGIAPWL